MEQHYLFDGGYVLNMEAYCCLILIVSESLQGFLDFAIETKTLEAD